MFDIGNDMLIEVVPSDATYMLAARHFQVDVYIFSSRSYPRVFRPGRGAAHAVRLFEDKNSYEKTSEIMVLGAARTPPKPTNIEQAPPSSYQSQFPAAVFRQEARKRTITANDHSGDAAAFKMAW